jgi:hypothetical protein
MMVELAVTTGRPLAELRELQEEELATFVDVVEGLRRGLP